MAGTCCYDGSLAGLLTLLASLDSGSSLPDSISVEPPRQQGLFDGDRAVTTDPVQAEAFWQRLEQRIGPAALAPVPYAFQADHPDKELAVSRYLLLGLHEGPRVRGMLAHPRVAPLMNLARQVQREAHRYLGFVRFREVTGSLYYAAISPDHRVLPLIARHFADRFRDQQWVIHDCRHGEGLVYDRDRRQWLLLPMEVTAEPEPTPAEELFQTLWRSYFATLAIEERRNVKLQQSKVPLKTRPWLTEFEG